MFEYQVHTERNRDYHIIAMGERDGCKMFMDFTSSAMNAMECDAKRGYKSSGPNLGNEVEKARSYAEYASAYVTPDNHIKFNTVQRERSGLMRLTRKGDPLRGYTFVCYHSK